uniref:peptidyl-tRNA hydrolase n=1 Tax=Strigamia maritima TaxID=126957 RepID=T1JCY8_STRMM
MSSPPLLVQYVIIRGDLQKVLKWSLGAIIAQACHATAAIVYTFRNDPNVMQYTKDLDKMHKVILEIPDDISLQILAATLSHDNIDFKLWIEQPENIATCLATKPKKMTIFTDAKETTMVYELKKIIEGITKVTPAEQRLYRDELMMEDTKSLADYGLTSAVAKAQAPATIGLVCKLPDGSFEALEMTPLSNPPELPDVMKPQDAQGHEQTVS